MRRWSLCISNVWLTAPLMLLHVCVCSLDHTLSEILCKDAARRPKTPIQYAQAIVMVVAQFGLRGRVPHPCTPLPPHASSSCRTMCLCRSDTLSVGQKASLHSTRCGVWSPLGPDGQGGSLGRGIRLAYKLLPSVHRSAKRYGRAACRACPGGVEPWIREKTVEEHCWEGLRFVAVEGSHKVVVCLPLHGVGGDGRVSTP